MVPLAIVSGLLMWRFFGNYVQAIELLMNEPPGPDFNLFPFLFDSFGGFYGGLLLLSLLGVAAQAIVILSLTVQCIEALHGGSMTLAAGIRRGLRRFWSYVGMVIVQWAAIFAATVAVIIPFGGGLLALVIGGRLLGSNFWNTGEAPSIISLIGIGVVFICGYIFILIVSLVPVVYLSARWLVAPAALIAERTGPLDSLRRSWRLSRGNVVRTVGYVIILNSAGDYSPLPARGRVAGDHRNHIADRCVRTDDELVHYALISVFYYQHTVYHLCGGAALL